MNFPLTLVKATLLAAVIFWTIIISGDRLEDATFIIMISIIPIFLSCLIVLATTIAPFFWFKKDSITTLQMTKKYFPFYAIVCFGICCNGIILTDFDIFFTSFFTSAFFTTMYSWIWFLKHSR